MRWQIRNYVADIANVMYQSRFRMKPTTQPKLNIDTLREINVIMDISMGIPHEKKKATLGWSTALNNMD
ncbi:hypothetical protein [Xenorhabdus bovienii]|nr:hypothetical protein [Xenorhabdus bovienii]